MEYWPQLMNGPEVSINSGFEGFRLYGQCIENKKRRQVMGVNSVVLRMTYVLDVQVNRNHFLQVQLGQNVSPLPFSCH